MFFSKLKAWSVKHMPSSQQLAGVYGIIVLLVYGWTIYWFLWKLPSWLYFMTLGEILVTLAYAMVVNFLESMLVLVVPVFLSLVLPPRWFRDQFAARGATLVLFSLALLAYYLGTIITLQDIPSSLGWTVWIGAIGVLALVFIFSRISLLRKIMEEIANRATIFLYIFLPISAVSILVVLIRNLVEAING